jgi:hypothetical protein
MMMTRLNLAVLASALILLASGNAIAEELSKKSYSNHQFAGQRPYMKAPVQDNTYNAEDKWQGATLVSDINPDEAATNKGHDQHQQMRLNFLGKRPF